MAWQEWGYLILFVLLTLVDSLNPGKVLPCEHVSDDALQASHQPDILYQLALQLVRAPIRNIT